MIRPRSCHRTVTLQRGWTLTEILLVVTIVLVLLTLSFPAARRIRALVDRANCMANMRSLHAGLSVYLQDHNLVWPQEPNSDDDDEIEDWTWWYETLKPYDIPKKTWICPADRDGTENDNTDGAKLISSYAPTQFDDEPNSAYRWMTPWIIERGQNHGHQTGPNMVLPNGDVIEGIGIPIEEP